MQLTTMYPPTHPRHICTQSMLSWGILTRHTEGGYIYIHTHLPVERPPTLNLNPFYLLENREVSMAIIP